MKFRLHKFEVHGGQTEVRGKPNWPDRLSLVMSRSQAWNLVSSLLQQLRHEETYIESPFMGELDFNMKEE